MYSLASVVDYAVSRELNTLYIVLDIGFLCFLGFVLWKHERKTAFWFGVAGALLYFIVDYGIFYLLLGTREVHGANTALFLLWLSTSYGFTNFAWIWLFLDKDKKIKEWSLLIVISWFALAVIAQSFGGSFNVIQITRQVGSYHGWMALILLGGYAYVIVANLNRDKNNQLPISYMLFVGILVQLSWEVVLLITGIRPQGWQPLIVNSLLETNLGLPYLYFIHKGLKQHMAKKENLQLSEIKQ